jgi:hypothetical protein
VLRGALPHSKGREAPLTVAAASGHEQVRAEIVPAIGKLSRQASPCGARSARISSMDTRAKPSRTSDAATAIMTALDAGR